MPALVTVFTLAPEITLLLRTDIPPRRLATLLRAVEAFAAMVGAEGADDAKPTG